KGNAPRFLRQEGWLSVVRKGRRESLVRYSLLQEIDQGQTLPEGGQDWSLRLRPGGQAGERQSGHEIHWHHEGFGKGRRCNRKQRRSGRDRCNRKRGGGKRGPLRRIRIDSVE